MMKRIAGRLLVVFLLVALLTAVTDCGGRSRTAATRASRSLETLRAYVDRWLVEAGNDNPIISSFMLKEGILDDWPNQGEKYQIVSVRSPEDYMAAGHIANAVNIYWPEIITDTNLARLDPHKTLILYCYYGHGSMLACTILGLLGYKCRSLDFGMMDWNLDALIKEPWDKKADYEVETVVRVLSESYCVPVLAIGATDAKSMIRKMARKYLGGEGSPVIRPSNVKAVVDNWKEKKSEYQIVDVRSGPDYRAGHVPNALNIPLADVAKTESLMKLDPKRTLIVCSENGQTGQIATTVLNLLGYHAVNMLFGMMDWNTAYVDKSLQWDGVADYPVTRDK